jgi:hypothetical protein
MLLIMAFLWSGCMLLQKEGPVIPDERAGPNLVVYFAEKGYSKAARDTRRLARSIAAATGGELFALDGKEPLPDLLRFNTFFVGGALVDGHIAAPLEDFLAQTDFMDGRVVPFWAGDRENAGLNGDFERRMRGARFLPGGGFVLDRRTKAKDLEAMAETWAALPLAELGLRQAAGGDQAEDMAKLFAAAYPERLSPAVFQDGDWTFEMDGERWQYAQGRMLPLADVERAEEFRPQFLYQYRLEPAGASGDANPWQDVAEDILSRRSSSGAYNHQPYTVPGAARSPFYEALWQTRSREEAYSQQQWIAFLGRQVQTHRGIAAPLARAEERILALAEEDPEIQGWIKNLASITGWNWRNVAGSANRSYHSYGIAVDLLMKAQAGMETYWQWTEAKGINYRSVPMEKRQNPPSAVIRIFEDQGFIWGGRWSRYDTMHFEYHPELLILGTGRRTGSAV